MEPYEGGIHGKRRKMQLGDLTVEALIDFNSPGSFWPASRGLSGLAELASLQQPELNVCGWLAARLLACHSAG